jgi:DNA polymerase III delta prime subunit
MAEGFKPKDMMWIEKYRPKHVKDVIGEHKQKVLKYLENPSSIPHFLLYSVIPGTGKTSLSKAIINDLKADYLIINSSDDRKIEVIREKVKKFAITQSSNKDVRRIIFLDEADGMLKASQDALRNIMETYATNVIFILTCNNIHKIIEPLQSRCVSIEFTSPKKEDIFIYLEDICKKESMKYTPEGINKIISLHYPSIRNCVKHLQDLHVQGVEVNETFIERGNELFEGLWQKLKEKKWQDIKQKVLEDNINARELNKHFWHRSVETSNVKGIQVTCRNERDIAFGADPQLIFISSLIELSQ